MATMAQAKRLAIARKRLQLVLRARVIANGRTLEQKISDAGPGPMRVDPHLLTAARSDLIKQGVIVRKSVGRSNTPWFHLQTAIPEAVEARLAEVKPIHDALLEHDFTLRMGQTLEIAAYRAFIQQPAFRTFGAFPDLDEHDDSTAYIKEEPPSVISGRKSKGKLDFVLTTTDNDLVGVELKNVREWLYPDRDEVTELLRKCTDLDALPVLIARRVPFVTFKLLNTCGVIIHQTYNQLFPAADAELAAKASHKDLLGYHDIRVGNQPDARFTKFVGVNLPPLITSMRPAFDEFKDLLADFANGELSYSEFAARVRRRSQGTNEDSDWEEDR
jgi:hypothetical protein